ncbi:alpha-L-fucosidase [Aestuariibaculum sediminum]|uniref:alpha-L-fucosidase n=1 Tax=Aestuariibaculum sediminum TaxID=2770637 RepID=A0A8J6QHE5_9FLAO|nr:alpha-L-fucosidase [Aestuariibaculum sediminum]MBD0831894.1 alpha-L-fucosidase [Aestuariibaculum sediminum]
MSFKVFLIVILSGVLVFNCKEAVAPPTAYGPVPTKKQLNWHDMEFYAFVHFSLNTFTNKEWGYGDESPELFNPTHLDCNQWAKVVKDAGMKGIIITAKHHDGFCLWPSKFTDRSVKNSPWKNGKGDVVKELAEACKTYGLKFGIYLSPWDRNHPEYGKPAYVTYFRNQLQELLTNYGDVFEMWFDGANGGDGYYGGANEIRKINTLEYYDWEETYKMIYDISPNTLVWGIGPSEARWIGNERGRAGKTNWCLLRQKDDLEGKVHYTEYMNGHEDGEKWVPGEADVSIRPGWFYHESEDDKVRPLEEMVDIYYESIGRNANLLLNLPVDKTGQVNAHDIQRLQELTAVIKADFKEDLLRTSTATATDVRGNSNKYAPQGLIDDNKTTYWATNDSIKNASVTFNFDKATAFNRLELQEFIKLGQRVKRFSIQILTNNQWKTIAEETTIGYKRILRFPRIETSALRLNITDSKANIVLASVRAYNAPDFVRMPSIKRDQSGMITMECESGNTIYFTTDGSIPTVESELYKQPIKKVKNVTIKARSFNKKANKYSALKTSHFKMLKANWGVKSVSGGDLKTSNQVIDNNSNTVWSFNTNSANAEKSIVIDLGSVMNLQGFTYLSKQHGHQLNLISKYTFYVSNDFVNWNKVTEGEFANIENNPIEQFIQFKPLHARYIKFVAKEAVNKTKPLSIAELGVITYDKQIK